MKEDKQFSVECECGCRVMMVKVYFDEEEKIWEYYFCMYETTAATRKWTVFKNRLRGAWKILWDGQYYKDQITLTQKQAETFAKKINEIVTL